MVEQIPDSLEQSAPQIILIVDDEARMRRFIRMNMELEGFQVLEAENGVKALDQIRKFNPDLILMDVMMPEMDGFETLRLLREISTVPVILLTVKSDEEDKIRGLGLGADDYITKPFSPRELNSRVNAVVRRAQWPAPPPRTRAANR
ncbi:MAG: response regulator [Chloroflexi bacterium]|nr:response regulator [Chloroflexota bacterium]